MTRIKRAIFHLRTEAENDILYVVSLYEIMVQTVNLDDHFLGDLYVICKITRNTFLNLQ